MTTTKLAPTGREHWWYAACGRIAALRGGCVSKMLAPF